MFAVLCAIACGSDPSPESAPQDAAAAVDTENADAGAIGDTNDAAVANECPGAADCPCATHDECGTGLCLETLAGFRCARQCQDGCAEGFDCKPFVVGADTVSLCLSRWFRVCDPCELTADCRVPGLGGGHCVRMGDSGSFCGANCKATVDCPVGSRCGDVTSAEGVSVKQCVPIPQSSGEPFGVCGCSKGAVARSAATTCRYTASDKGPPLLCSGRRRCGPDGLSVCQAASKTPVCKDAQCEGKTAGTACDDGDGCTTADACAKIGEDLACKPGDYTCACKVDSDCKDDGDLCNGVPYCDKSAEKPACKPNPATVVVCKTVADTPCAQTACVPSTGKCVQHKQADKAPCDDGEPCTKGDACNGKGHCIPGPDTCPCKTTADCANKDDGDLCNGTLYCDVQANPPACALNLATVITCPTVDDTDCAKSVCAPTTGACETQLAQDAATCSDGDPCTASDSCKAGKCAPGTNTCACQTSADCAGKDDGDLCNGTLFCDTTTHKCAANPATLITCPTVNDTECLASKCVPATGACQLAPLPEGKPCDDGDPCTKAESCAKGGCGGGTSTCVCKEDIDCNAFDDANPCNGTLFCHKPTGGCRVNPGTIPVCPGTATDACTALGCVPATGKCGVVPGKVGAACDDGNACTTDEACALDKDGALGCVAAKIICPCQADTDCAKFDDGNPCTGVLVCKKASGTCVANPGSVIVCSKQADSPCLLNTCDPKLAKCATKPVADGKDCDDGTVCTKGGMCKAGACSVGGGGCLRRRQPVHNRRVRRQVGLQKHREYGAVSGFGPMYERRAVPRWRVCCRQTDVRRRRGVQHGSLRSQDRLYIDPGGRRVR